MKRIHEFEALRGFLALWVVVGHVIKHSGYAMTSLGPLSLLGDPGLAVDVFIILSGFVIFSLIDHKHEGYVPFILRRFFRLYPLYIVVLAVAALLAGAMLDWIQTFPWRTPFLDNLIPIAQASKDALPAQVFVHLTMLHGLVPDSVLRFSQYGLVGQAWSISVEWQFYLLAPLFFLLLRRRPALLALALAGLVALHSRYWLGEGFALNQGQYFLIGIVSYFAFKHGGAARLSGAQLLLGAAVAIAAAAWLTTRPASLALWAVVFAAAVHARNGGVNPISSIAGWRLPQMFGRISYSIYLWHMFIILLVSRALLDGVPGIGQFQHAAILIPVSLALTVALSWLSFRVIEKPGMDLGQSLARRMRPRGGQAVAESA